ncbi:Nuclear pore complex protein NUP35-like protein [Drosera capensis]
MSSSTPLKTPKSTRQSQSLLFSDLASPSPLSSRRPTSGQAAAVSALWRENFSSSDLPPPPIFTLDDRSEFSPETGVGSEYPLGFSPEGRSATPVRGSGGGGSERGRGKGEVLGLNWWSPGKGGGGGSVGEEEKGKGSPVEGVLQGERALITVPVPREVARPEGRRSVSGSGGGVVNGAVDEEEWVTVYGFPPADTNLVLREFEKCGVILKHVPGPRNANWMHILYQNRSDAQRALSKNGMLVDRILIVGVKPADPLQQLVLNERINNQGFMTLPLPSPSRSSEPTPSKPAKPYYVSNGTGSSKQPTGAIASPEKSVVSKIMDLMFGL